MIDTRWPNADPNLLHQIEQHRREMLGAYASDPNLVREHANQEDSIRNGGYGERILLELIQNAADAIAKGGEKGRVEVWLTDGNLYVANEGASFDASGLTALTHAFLSSKRGEEIGRFGLGFKSVLSVSDSPLVVGRSVSFAFNTRQNRADLEQIVGPGSSLPKLRLMEAVDPTELPSDVMLSQLMEWATTVVVLPQLTAPRRVAGQIRAFNGEFLLFAPSVRSLRLVDLDSDDSSLRDGERLFECEDLSDGRKRVSSAAGRAEQVWHVVERQHTPSAKARADAGEAIARDSVRLTYAVPARGSGLGRFWSYFALQDETTASGIFNAPWKVNDDRTTLIGGEYNRELIGVFADMFLEVLPRLSSSDDPAQHLDALPARGKELRSWGDGVVSEQINRRAAFAAIVPDLHANRCKPAEISPVARYGQIPQVDFQLWAAAARHADLNVLTPHESTYKTSQRRTRLRELLEANRTSGNEMAREMSVSAWLELLTERRSDAAIGTALEIAEHLTGDRDLKPLALAARLIPTVSGRLAAPSESNEVFLGARDGGLIEGIDFVEPAFLASPESRRRLSRLGFPDVSAELELDVLLHRASDDWTAQDWDTLWTLVDDVPPRVARDLFETHRRRGLPMRVLTRDGQWRPPTNVFHPERSGLTLADPALMLDTNFHGVAADLMEIIGVICGVDPKFDLAADPLFEEYSNEQKTAFQARLARGTTSTTGPIEFSTHVGPGPLAILRTLADEDDFEGRAQWSAELLRAPADREWRLTRESARFDSTVVPAPHIWAIKKYGAVETSRGIRATRSALDPTLREYAAFLPVATSFDAGKLDLIRELDSIPLGIWQEFLGWHSDSEDGAKLFELIALAEQRLPKNFAPAALPAIVNSKTEPVAVSSIYIALSHAEFEFLRQRNMPLLYARDETAGEMIANRFGILLARDSITFEAVIEGRRDPVPATDLFSGLRTLPGDPARDLMLVVCESLAQRIGTPDGSEDIPQLSIVKGDTLFVTVDADERQQLALILRRLDRPAGGADVEKILRLSEDLNRKELVLACKAAAGTIDKLTVLFDRDQISKYLPKGLIAAVETLGEATDHRAVANLLVHVWGSDALHQMQAELEAIGLAPPREWSGSSMALDFVRMLGFDPLFAGERSPAVESMVRIPGRPGLAPLHDYQERLLTQIRELIRPVSGRSARKGLLYLPTGAGKTRVTVEAIVRSFTEGDISGPVVWIAQSEELCEQAVGTWSAVWRESEDLRTLSVGRLWSSHEVTDASAEVNVIVATDAKLDAIIKSEKRDYDWLRQASAIVVDEAHTAGDSPSYTRVLNWLGVGGRMEARAPLLGLTATPFKGASAERTERLAARFGNYRLEAFPGHDPYAELQKMGVLARVRHETLAGSELTLDASELDQAERMRKLSDGVLLRLDADSQRTLRLVEHISNLDPEWPVLVFTPRVLSAQVLAALLKSHGIPADSVSGETPRKERRRIIERFRSGETRVLTNCDVLTQGFDAPGVRALYLARPTLSPNAYIQMVGRGLRGPLNGGKEECLIVDVEDRFSNFAGQLAYTEFDYLWKGTQS